MNLEGYAVRRFHDEVSRFAVSGQDINALMAHCVRRNDLSELRELNGIVVGLIDLVRALHSDYWPQPYLRAFAQYLITSNSTVISFNYDSLIEEQLGFILADIIRNKEKGTAKFVLPYCYGLARQNYANLYEEQALIDVGSGYLLTRIESDGLVLVLKLHGSIGWYYCSICGLIVYLPPPHSPMTELIVKTTVSGQFQCPNCNTDQTFDMLFVPPATDTTFPRPGLLDDLWQQAEVELADADILIIAGYSLPKDDRRAQSLLAKTVSRRNDDLKILVVDPYLSPELQARFRNTMKNCTFYQGTFDDFLGDLCAIWCGFEPSRSLGQWADAMVANQACRKDSPINHVPIDSKLKNLLAEATTADSFLLDVPGLIGVSGTEAAMQLLAWAGATKSCTKLRAMCVQALGNVHTQTALDELVNFTFDFSTVSMESAFPPMNYEIAVYACMGIRQLMLTSPKLDYSTAAGALGWIYGNPDASEYLRNYAFRTFSLGFDRGLIRTP